MRKTRKWSRTGSVLIAAAFFACGRAESDGDGTNSGGDGGQLSTGGNGTNTGGAGGHGASAASTATGGTSDGASAGQTQTSGGRSATGGSKSTGGNSASGGKAAGGAASGGALSGGVAGGGVSGGGNAGGDDAAGGAGLGGQGGAGECPAIKCTAQCAEYWVGLDGCQSCACAPPAPKLVIRDVSCPPASLTISETSSYVIGGGYDHWLLDFDWACSDASLLGEPSRARLQVGLTVTTTPPADATNRTYFYPKNSLEYTLRSATVWARGSGVPEIEIPLNPSSSFISVRIENGRLVGGVELIGSDSAGTFTATLAGPFSGEIPSPN